MDEDFERIAPLQLQAVEFQDTLATGRSRPVLVDGLDPSGRRHAVVMKLRDPSVDDGTPWLLCAVRDMVGSLLAARLGLDTPRAAIVEVGETFARALTDHPEGSRLQRNIGPNFGSVRIERQVETTPSRPDLWRPILSFDAMCLNRDRMGGNPNVLWTGERLMLIDHGLIAPSWTFHVDGTDARTLFGEFAIRTHAGYATLRHRDTRFDDLAERWSAEINGRFLAWVRTQIPSGWASSRDVSVLLDFLAVRHTIADPQARELAEVLLR